MRYALERIIQQGKGGLVVLGQNDTVKAASSGGFVLNGASFNPARLAELSKMDGGIVLDDSWEVIIAANVHFVPDGSIPTDETGARHRTAERLAIEAEIPVVAVSEGRRVATLFYGDHKIELATPTEVAAYVNHELQTLERLRNRLDEAEDRLTRLEVSGMATNRAVVTVVQRAELAQRLGSVIRDRTRTLGDQGRIATLQLNDLLTGVRATEELVLADYLRPLRSGSVSKALNRLGELSGSELEDPARVAKEIGLSDLDDSGEARGHRLLSQVGRLPDSVRDDIVRHFGSVSRLLKASEAQLIDVEGVGATRAKQLSGFLHRLETAASEWEHMLD